MKSGWVEEGAGLGGESDVFHPNSGFYELAQIDGESFAVVGSPDGDYDTQALCCLRRTAVSGLPEKEELVQYRSNISD